MLLEIYQLILGLEITKIYTAFEFKAQRCFEEFGKKVTEARRASDRDPAYKPVGELKKVIRSILHPIDNPLQLAN